MDRGARSEPPLPAVEDRDQIVVLRGLSWGQYDALLRARGPRATPRMAYLDGELELMTTSARHEIVKKLLARLVEAFAEERDISLDGIGNTTFRKRAKAAGLEPDECYCIGGIKRVPELTIEIVHTSGGIDKLEIYRRLGVGEVWFWIEDRIWAYRQVGDRFQHSGRSHVLPGLDLGEIARIVAASDGSRQTETVKRFRCTLRRG